MNKILLTMFLSLTLISVLAMVHKVTTPVADNTRTGEVMSVNVYEDEDCHWHHDNYVECGGDVFRFDEDGYAKYDKVVLTFDDMGTADVVDDEIIDVRKVV